MPNWSEIYPHALAKAQAKHGMSALDFNAIIDGWVAAGGDVEEPATLYLAATERIDLTGAEVLQLVLKQLDHQKELAQVAYRTIPPKG